MASFTIIRLIGTSIIFGLILTTSDQGSDIYLMIRTYLFAGNTLGVIACKYCSMELTNAKSLKKTNICRICTEENFGRKDGGLYCGVNPLAMERLSRFENSCEVGDWSLDPEKNVIGTGLSYCDRGHTCCIKSFLGDNDTTPSVQSNDLFQGNHMLVEKYRYTDKCELSLIIGSSDNKYSCNKIFRRSNLYKELKKDCNEMNYYFNGTRFTEGICNVTNGCCIITNKIKSADCKKNCNFHLMKRNFKAYFACCNKIKASLTKDLTFRRCRKTVCERHIDFIKSISTSVHNEATWTKEFVTFRGKSLGGGLCAYLKNLSITMFFPIIIHWILVCFVWLDDVQKEKTTSLSIVFLILNSYSQFRLVCKLFKFYNNEDRLRNELNEQDVRVTSLECIFEAIIQVSKKYSL